MKIAYKKTKHFPGTQSEYMHIEEAEKTFCCDAMHEAWKEELFGFDNDIQDLGIGVMRDDYSNCYYQGDHPDKVVAMNVNYCPFCAAKCVLEEVA